jgi:hypothetical protein
MLAEVRNSATAGLAEQGQAVQQGALDKDVAEEVFSTVFGKPADQSNLL